LSEVPRGHSLGFSGTFGALLATGLFIITEKLEAHILRNDYSAFLSSEIYKKIFLLAWKFDLISTYGSTTGHNALIAFSTSPLPTLRYTEHFTSDIAFEGLGNLYGKFEPIGEKFKNAHHSEIMFDYGMIFSGIPTDTRQVEIFRKADSYEFDKIKEIITEDVLDEQSMNENIYFKKFLDKDCSIYHTMSDILSILGIKTVYLFKKMFRK